FVKVNGVTSSPHSAHLTAPWPIPSTFDFGFFAPQLGHTPETNGSPVNRPSIGLSLPEAVASDVTRIDLIWIATASPASAPSTQTGFVTSWPHFSSGVIIGPQQPGAVLATMWPPSFTK